MPTLPEIAEQEHNGIVLFDCSVGSIDYFLEHIFYAGKYADLDRELLEDKVKLTGQFLEFVLRENTFTVKAAILDFKSVYDRTRYKHSYFNDRKKKMNGHANFKKYNSSAAEAEKDSLFGQIAANISEIYMAVRFHKLFIPDNIEVYGRLYEEIPKILGSGASRQELNPRHRELYAAALYSLTQKPVNLIVAGRDFSKGLIFLIESSCLKQHPISLYFMDYEGNYNIAYRA